MCHSVAWSTSILGRRCRQGSVSFLPMLLHQLRNHKSVVGCTQRILPEKERVRLAKVAHSTTDGFQEHEAILSWESLSRCFLPRELVLAVPQLVFSLPVLVVFTSLTFPGWCLEFRVHFGAAEIRHVAFKLAPKGICQDVSALRPIMDASISQRIQPFLRAQNRHPNGLTHTGDPNLQRLAIGHSPLGFFRSQV